MSEILFDGKELKHPFEWYWRPNSDSDLSSANWMAYFDGDDELEDFVLGPEYKA